MGILQVVVGIATFNDVVLIPGVLPEKIMSVRRGPEKACPLHWNLPGGKVEPGEPLKDALIREWEEEVACKPTKVDWSNPWVKRYDKLLIGGLITPFEMYAYWVEEWKSTRFVADIPFPAEPGTMTAYIETAILKDPPSDFLVIPWLPEILKEIEESCSAKPK